MKKIIIIISLTLFSLLGKTQTPNTIIVKDNIIYSINNINNKSPEYVEIFVSLNKNINNLDRNFLEDSVMKITNFRCEYRFNYTLRETNEKIIKTAGYYIMKTGRAKNTAILIKCVGVATSAVLLSLAKNSAEVNAAISIFALTQIISLCIEINGNEILSFAGEDMMKVK